MEIKVGQIFRNKKGKRVEIIAIYNGSVEVKRYVHRDSKNCELYKWDHNSFSFTGCELLSSFISSIKKQNWKLENKSII